MKYIDIVKGAKASGTFNESTMWLSVQNVSDLLDEIKDEHKELYWSFMRKEAGLMSGYHYNEKWAEHDVSKIEWTDKEGKKHQGAYWTAEQVEEATKGMQFPAGVTKWDKFVAMNIAKSDMCKVLDDEKILQVGYEFFFKDEDWSEKGSSDKVFRYMCCKYSM